MGADAKRKKRTSVKNDSDETLRQSKGADNDVAEPTSKRFCLAVDAPKAFALVEKSRRSRTTESRLKSRVVLIRGLPENVITADLIDSLSRFGPISYTKCHFKQGWAFVEFEDEEGSESCVKYGYENAVCIGGNEVFMMYSLHHVLDRDALERREPNKVILMSISNIQKEIKVQDVHVVCSQYGQVERIKISPISRGVEMGLLVFVEFDTVEAAHKAKLAVNGAFFYEDCNLIHCEYASLETLIVPENTDHAHDYYQSRKVPKQDPVCRLVPYDSSPDSSGEDQHTFSNEVTVAAKDTSAQHSDVPSPPSVRVEEESVDDFNVIDTCPHVTEFSQSVAVKDDAQNYEYVQWSSERELATTALVQPFSLSTTRQNSPTEAATQRVASLDVRPDAPSSSSSGTFAISVVNSGLANHFSNLRSSDDSGLGSSGDLNSTEGPRCMMVYGIELKSGKFSCDRLFNLMCMYGHVVAIKLVLRKKDAAIVEFAHSNSVKTAMKMLHNISLFGCSLTFDFGRTETIRYTLDRFPDGLPACEIYTGCPLQRFERFAPTESSSKNRITSPTSVLYWWDAPPYTTKDMIYKMFHSVGAPKPSKVSPFFPRQYGSVGIAEFESPQRAAEALMLANHYPILTSGFRGPAIVKLTFATGRNQSQNGSATS